MKYILITLLSILFMTVILYYIANLVLHLGIRKRPLILSACCAILLSLVIPKLIVYTNIADTLIILVFASILLAYGVSSYDSRVQQVAHDPPKEDLVYDYEFFEPNNVNFADNTICEQNSLQSEQPTMANTMTYESLDDLIDDAVTKKESGNYFSAINLYKQGLCQYPNDDAIPFIIVEIANIYKNLGDYDHAIAIFVDGKQLNIVKKSKTLEKEFINSIAFLRIIKNVLLVSKQQQLPFNEIPCELKEKIEAEFHEWLQQG